MKASIYTIIAAVVMATTGCRVQREASEARETTSTDTVYVMSYNIENFFDPEDDPEKNDEDFTPGGAYHWTLTRMKQKARRIARVIASATGSYHTPEIVGLCEIEGPTATEELIEMGGLDNGSGTTYRGLCYPTPDKRGIAVAMLYDYSRLELLDSRPISVSVPDSGMWTRDVLLGHFRLRTTREDFYVMVNHWPSKYGGATETIWKRNHVADCVRMACDSLLKLDADAKIILVGDFNDTSDVDALTTHLGAKTRDNTCTLCNLSDDTEDRSYKYQGAWNTIDHIIVSPGVCANGRPAFNVVRLPFLLEPDDRYTGDKPKRTYIGRSYNYSADNNGGYSDHLPVMIKIAF